MKYLKILLMLLLSCFVLIMFISAMASYSWFSFLYFTMGVGLIFLISDLKTSLKNKEKISEKCQPSNKTRINITLRIILILIFLISTPVSLLSNLINIYATTQPGYIEEFNATTAAQNSGLLMTQPEIFYYFLRSLLLDIVRLLLSIVLIVSVLRLQKKKAPITTPSSGRR